MQYTTVGNIEVTNRIDIYLPEIRPDMSTVQNIHRSIHRRSDMIRLHTALYGCCLTHNYTI